MSPALARILQRERPAVKTGIPLVAQLGKFQLMTYDPRNGGQIE